jgi:predicted GH43/DUF377 family glycosyl hydrolase
MKLRRYSGNPILAPTGNWWETRCVLNAGAAVLNGRVHLLYRAIGDDNVSRFGYASSRDGFEFDIRPELPVYEPAPDNQWERLGCEDPRIAQIGDTFYVVFTGASLYAAEHGPTFGFGPPWRCRVSMISTKDFRVFEHHGVILPDHDDKDAALFPEKINGRYAMLHRILPDICVSFSDDLIHWGDSRKVISPRKTLWDGDRIGAGGAPIKTERGWLNFYHGVDEKRVYRLGVLILDPEDPTKVVYRSVEPCLEPEEPYEKEGPVPNVVFSCGAVEKDGRYLVYYGGADRVVCAASIGVEDTLRF